MHGVVGNRGWRSSESTKEETPGVVGRPWLGDSSARLAILLLVFGLRLAVPRVAHAQQPTGDGWVGRRVVQRFNGLKLRIQDRIVKRGRSIHFYRVEQVNGPWLWIHSDGNGLVGWVKADEMVLVDQGIEFFTNQIRNNAQDSFSYVMRATLWQDKKQIDKALADYDQAIKLDPGQAWIYNDRGILWAEKKDHDRAIADFNEALRLEPQNANVYNNRGTARRNKYLHDEAIVDFSEAIRINPEYAFAYYNRALAQADKGLFAEATADLDVVIRLEPNDAYAYYNRGLAWLDLKEYDKAVADFDQTARLDPRLLHACYQRGRACFAKQEYDKAIADFNHTIELSPKSYHAYYYRGLAWARKKEYGKALADYDEAIRLNPRFDEAYLDRAWLRATCPDARYRDPKKAVESATKACELTGWEEAHDLGGLAAVYAETGNVAAAVKWQSRAIELMTNGKTQESTPLRPEPH